MLVVADPAEHGQRSGMDQERLPRRKAENVWVDRAEHRVGRVLTLEVEHRGRVVFHPGDGRRLRPPFDEIEPHPAGSEVGQ